LRRTLKADHQLLRSHSPTANQIGGQVWQPIEFIVRPAIFNSQILTLNVTRLFQPLAKCDQLLMIRAGEGHRNPITGTAGCCARAASGNVAAVPPIKGDELSPPHELPSVEAHNLAHHWTISAPVHRSEIFPLMSVQGHFRQIDPLPTLSACPLRSDRVRTFAPQRIDAMCNNGSQIAHSITMSAAPPPVVIQFRA
jgi:hypothetical protein